MAGHIMAATSDPVDSLPALDQSPRSHITQQLYSSLALPSGNMHHAHPIWSKPSIDQASTAGQIVSSTHALLAANPVSSRIRSRTGGASRPQSQLVSPPTSGESTPAMSLDQVQLYSQQLHQQLATQQLQQQLNTQVGSPNDPSESRSRGSLAQSNTNSPPNSGSSSPGNSTLMRSHLRPQVLETHKLELQTHLPSGRRMVNKYIIEGELGRGVHGKVRLARDTDTGEKVAVKIVERESRKKLGGGLGFQGRAARERQKTAKRDSYRDRAPSLKDFGDEARIESNLSGQERDAEVERRERVPSSPSTKFAPLPSAPRSPAASLRHGRWGDLGPSRPTYADKEAEKQKQKEREKARKALLWTTDQKVRREIAIMKKCSHENVVRLREVIDDPQSKKIFMVLEFMEGGEIVWKNEAGLPTLTVEESRRILRDVVCGLEYLHYQGIIHRDIKPANLLWDKEHRVKISDFGVSHFSYAMMLAHERTQGSGSGEGHSSDPSLADDHELAKTAGSPAFFAPELCMSGDVPNSASLTPSFGDAEYPFSEDGRSPPARTLKRPPITKAIDIWALGVTLYCLLFGHTPFTAESEFALFSVIPTTDYGVPMLMGADRVRVGPRRPRWKSSFQWVDEEADAQPETPIDLVPDVCDEALSEDARQLRDLLDRLLEKDPTKRIKLEGVKQHPWVTRGLEDAPAWLSETDPTHHPFVEVSHADVEDALTGFSKFKQRVRQWQSKLFGSLGSGRRSRSVSQLTAAQMAAGEGSAASSRSSPTALRRALGDSNQSSPLMVLGDSAPATSTLLSPRTPLLGKPHGFSRRQSAQSVGRVNGSQAMKAFASADPATRDTNNRKEAVPGVASGASSASHSRPQSPLHSDAASMLRQISYASPTVSNGHLDPNLTLRPPIVQRRSSSTALSVRLTPPDIPQRKSSDTHAQPATAEASLHAVFKQHAHFALPEAPASGNAKMRSPELNALSQTSSCSAGQSSEGHAVRVRVSSESDGRSSLASVSQTSRVSHRNRLGDFLKGGWLQYGDGGQRSSLRSGTMSSREGPSSTFREASESPADGAAQLTIDASGATRQLGPRPQAGMPISAPLPPVSAFQSTGNEGSLINSPSSDQLSTDGYSSQAGRFAAMSQPSSPPTGTLMSFGSSSVNRHNSDSQPRMVNLEHDDVDLDLELSDDDFEDEPRHSSGAVLTNYGSGWIVRQDSDFLPEMMQHKGSDVSSQDMLTPSVEGGYNVFKPPYRHILSQAPSSGSDLRNHISNVAANHQTFDLDADLSTEAEALRRAESTQLRTEQELQGFPELISSPPDSLSPSRSSSQKSYTHSNEASMSQSHSHSRMEALPEGHAITGSEGSTSSQNVPKAGDSGVVLAGDVTRDQFADADEEGASSSKAADEKNPDVHHETTSADSDSDEEMCISFQAKKKSSRMLRAQRN